MLQKNTPPREVPVSVVIPAYNRARTLDRVLESIKKQSVAPDEVIVVDDGSTDSTMEVLMNWKALGVLPLKVVQQSNRGASAARNAGIRTATGDVIAFIDSDDEYAAHAIMTLKGLFQKHPEAIVAFGDAEVLENGRTKTDSFLRRRLTMEDQHYDSTRLVDPAGMLLFGAFQGAFACRKDALLAVGGYDESLARVNDRDLYLRLAMSVSGDWVFTWDKLETKHYTEGSLSSRKNRRLHYETQIKVLGKHVGASQFATLDGKRLFRGAVKQSTVAAIDWAGRESPVQVIRTMVGIPRFAWTWSAYRAAAVTLGLSAGGWLLKRGRLWLLRAQRHGACEEAQHCAVNGRAR
jgi:hypothetical protein